MREQGFCSHFKASLILSTSDEVYIQYKMEFYTNFETILGRKGGQIIERQLIDKSRESKKTNRCLIWTFHRHNVKFWDA